MPEGGNEPTCEACGRTTHREVVSIALWAPTGLVVVEGIPSDVCDGCGEHFYDERAQTRLRHLTSNGFPEKDVVRSLTVPVFSLTDEMDADDNEVMEEVA